MSDQPPVWFYHLDGQQRGPVSDSGLRNLLREGVIDADAPVWTEGMGQWESALIALPRYVPAAQQPLYGEAVFFPVSAMKFAIMSLLTFGLYELYWGYRQWSYLKRSQGLKISPFWRAWFQLFFTYGLLKYIRGTALQHGSRVEYSSGWLTVGYLVTLVIGSRLPVPYGIVGALAWLFLLPVVNAVNEVNRALGTSADQLNTKLAKWNWLAVAIGGLMWLAILTGPFLPQAPR